MQKFIGQVTLTGADHSIRPEDLFFLQDEHSFVEWGILFSKSSAGKSRYPHRQWLDDLRSAALHHRGLKLCAHLCGFYVKELLEGRITVFEEHDLSHFKRVQINLGLKGLILAKGSDLFRQALVKIASQPNEPEIIIGGNILGAGFTGVHFADSYERWWMPHQTVYPLFDCSGGNGISPTEWPRPFKHIYCGLAGGLGPDNLESELPKIGKAVEGQKTWIDMESSLRSVNHGYDVFDLAKAERVLRIAGEWIKYY